MQLANTFTIAGKNRIRFAQKSANLRPLLPLFGRNYRNQKPDISVSTSVTRLAFRCPAFCFQEATSKGSRSTSNEPTSAHTSHNRGAFALRLVYKDLVVKERCQQGTGAAHSWRYIPLVRESSGPIPQQKLGHSKGPKAGHLRDARLLRTGPPTDSTSMLRMEKRKATLCLQFNFMNWQAVH